MIKEKRPAIICYGYCQAGAIHKCLCQIPWIIEHFDLYSQDLSDFPQPPEPEILERCTHFIYQLTPIDTLPDWGRLLASKVHAVRFPCLYCEPVWPQHSAGFYDPRQPELQCGLFPYGDSVLLDALKGERSTSAIVDEYLLMDLSTVFPMEKLTAGWRKLLEKLDEHTDIPVAEYVWTEWRRRRLFWTVNHPSNELVGHILRTLLRGLFGTEISEKAITEALRQHEMKYEVQPVHPSIARSLGLSWFSTDAHHRPDGTVFLREWATSYVDHCRSLQRFLVENGFSAALPGSEQAGSPQVTSNAATLVRLVHSR